MGSIYRSSSPPNLELENLDSAGVLRLSIANPSGWGTCGGCKVDGILRNDKSSASMLQILKRVLCIKVLVYVDKSHSKFRASCSHPVHVIVVNVENTLGIMKSLRAN